MSGPLLSARALARARREVGRKEPAFRRVRPAVRSRGDARWELTFQREVSLPDGATLRQLLRATVTEQGDVERIVLSR